MSSLPRAARRCAVPALSLLGVCLIPSGVLASPAIADGMRSREWYLDAMQADDMWQVSRGEGVTVAVLDSGIESSVPELQGQVLDGADLSSEPKGGKVDQDGHGTEMAALIAGTGSAGGIQGLAPGAKILPVKMPGDFKLGFVDSLWSKAIRYAVDHDARVINISAGSPGLLSSSSQTQEAVKYARDKGSLVFAAAGNDGDKGNVENYPASFPGVVSVGAVDSSRKVTKWSNSASHVTLAAPGDEIPGRCKESSGFCATRGTSQATALASASAALIWSKHPDWTNNQVLRVMMDTAGKPATGGVPSIYLGYGIVRPRKVLVDGEGNPGPADVNPLLAASQSASPKPSSSGDPKPSSPAQDSAAEPKQEEGSTAFLWPGIAIGAAVVAAVATGIVFLRRRGPR
ncbi:type VII secretion-associated serine protease mycosin [Streptomyces sp. ET3-23]|uniref:type VII secretion-associated serine protease mycosin n=1 Tax=Streptomyces sp. ET3-23 TaxID=2885643 RepID=UPI001D0FE7BF|nr:type VII secretion-associated serine protease mycosin [Streptomyces sp. ET3-23]MCC2280617.1 type VII secretion-associated serine protease mycosin [Streptomyces sp. ET3-23]